MGEGLLEVDSSIASLNVGLDGKELFVNEIVLEEGVRLLVECGEGLVFV